MDRGKMMQDRAVRMIAALVALATPGLAFAAESNPKASLTCELVDEGRELALTTKEFDLLALLASDPGAVVDRERLLREVWNTEWFGPTKTVDVHVASLRKKLGDRRWIETVRGVGLRLAPQS